MHIYTHTEKVMDIFSAQSILGTIDYYSRKNTNTNGLAVTGNELENSGMRDRFSTFVVFLHTNI